VNGREGGRAAFPSRRAKSTREGHLNRLTVIAAAIVGLMWVMTASALAQNGALARAKANGILNVCVDSYNFPASVKDADPPGYDIEILRAIARRVKLQLNYVFSDTGTRGGLGRALRTSISQQKCSLFMGLGIGDDSVEEMHEKHLVFTRPYMSLGFVLVVQGPAEGKTKISDFQNMRLGVAMSTPADAYLFDNHYDRSLFFRDRVLFKALNAGEINAALVWSADLAYVQRDFPAGVKFHPVAGYEPESTLRWNIAIAVPQDDTDLKQFLDDQIGELLKEGEVRKIVENYGIPFLDPMH
jgi:polar amino acid transport system substrate-binding protein